MPRSPRTISPGRVLRRHRAPRDDAAPLAPLKLRALDVAADRLNARTFADLGAVWAVQAGYAFALAARPGTENVAVVDDDITPEVRRRAASRPNITLIEGNFGDPAVADQIGDTDATVMFDVLLHQVAPDWDAVLAMYAPRTRCFVLAGPWYTAARRTVRLLDLGEAEYVASVPVQEINDGLFDRLDETHPRRDRPWRDVHDIWQWGITDDDLRARMDELGFALAHFEDAGPWRDLTRFNDRAYVFARTDTR